MTISTQNGYTVLTAGNGMKLTNGTIFTDYVTIGINDSISNWREVTDAEAVELQEILRLPDNPAINSVLSNIIEIGGNS